MYKEQRICFVNCGKESPECVCVFHQEMLRQTKTALQNLYNSYKDLAASGDAGFWTMDDVEAGREAREVLEGDSNMKRGLGVATEENSRNPDYGRDWGPWKEWDGSDEYGPMDFSDAEDFVQVHRRSPNSEQYLVAEAHHIDWKHRDSIDDILAYRVEV